MYLKVNFERKLSIFAESSPSPHLPISPPQKGFGN